MTRAVTTARLEEAEQLRLGRRLVRSQRMNRKAARAAARARRLSQLAAQAERRVGVAHTRTT